MSVLIKNPTTVVSGGIKIQKSDENTMSVKEIKGVFDGNTLQADVGGEYFDGKIVDVEKMLDNQKLPLNINVENAKIKVDDTEVDLIGEYDGTTIEIIQNGTLELEPLILENKLPLNVEVNVLSGRVENDTVAIYRETRNTNWAYLPLPSEIAATSNKDTVYLLYDASGRFVCPTFTLTYDGECLITIEKYMNTTLISSETIDGQNDVLVRMQYDYTDEDWDTYNYLLIKIEMQGDNPYLDKLNLTTKPQYNGVVLYEYTSNGLLEVSGNANLCEVLFGGSFNERNNKELTYFSFNGIARTSLSYMFNMCESLITLPEIKFVVNSDYTHTKSNHMFNSCDSLRAVPLFDTSNVTSMAQMFDGCSALQSIPEFNTSNVTDMRQMLYRCHSLQTVPLLDTSKVRDMSQMFYDCAVLKTVPLFDTSNVTSMGSIFYNCRSLQEVPLFNTSKVTSMSSMFSNCYSLQTVPEFNTSNVTSMNQTFNTCTSLRAVPLFDTSKVRDMGSMFNYCYALQTVPELDTSNVTSMGSMFRECYSLQTVPELDTSNVTSMSSMFAGCYALQSIPELDTSNVTGTSNLGYMFSSCYSLVDINMYNMKVAFKLDNSTLLTREAIVKVLNNLATVTASRTLTLGSTNLAKLTDEDKAIATNKGWTLA